jgi:hypothetical protein
MPKLTDIALVILSSAARRADGAVFPLPKSLKIKGGALKAMLDRLRKKGLLAEQPAAPDVIAWREDPDRGRLTLVLTEAAFQAIGADASEKSQQQPTPIKTDSKRPKRGTRRSNTRIKSTRAAAPRAGSKQALLLDLLTRTSGASLEEIAAATGWQPHSIRGAISGTIKKRLGVRVVSDKVEVRGRVYRIAARS